MEKKNPKWVLNPCVAQRGNYYFFGKSLEKLNNLPKFIVFIYFSSNIQRLGRLGLQRRIRFESLENRNHTGEDKHIQRQLQ